MDVSPELQNILNGPHGRELVEYMRVYVDECVRAGLQTQAEALIREYGPRPGPDYEVISTQELQKLRRTLAERDAWIVRLDEESKSLRNKLNAIDEESRRLRSKLKVVEHQRKEISQKLRNYNLSARTYNAIHRLDEGVVSWDTFVTEVMKPDGGAIRHWTNVGVGTIRELQRALSAPKVLPIPYPVVPVDACPASASFGYDGAAYRSVE